MPDTPTPDPVDGPEADGCGIDFAEHADDELTASLRPLFPDGDPSKQAEWDELFGGAPS